MRLFLGGAVVGGALQGRLYVGAALFRRVRAGTLTGDLVLQSAATFLKDALAVFDGRHGVILFSVQFVAT
ncbi:MAG: hypothetical protein AMXMBFR59_31400 [Rhodanobacteraceae bacterium]